MKNDSFEENIAFLRERITVRAAYLGVVGGFALFFFSLFLAWAKARTTYDVIDSGISTGWAEAGYISAMPLLLVLYKTLKGRTINVRLAALLLAISIGLLIFTNIVSRTTWASSTQCSDGDCAWGHNFGSDLGSGFWIGLVSILVIGTCGLAWSLHKADLETAQTLPESVTNEAQP